MQARWTENVDRQPSNIAGCERHRSHVDVEFGHPFAELVAKDLGSTSIVVGQHLNDAQRHCVAP